MIPDLLEISDPSDMTRRRWLVAAVGGSLLVAVIYLNSGVTTAGLR